MRFNKLEEGSPAAAAMGSNLGTFKVTTNLDTTDQSVPICGNSLKSATEENNRERFFSKNCASGPF